MHMSTTQTARALRTLRASFEQQTRPQQLATAQAMLRTTDLFIRQLKLQIHETDAASQRRTAKSRETEIDPKPPVKPVRVAEPSKPRKPKYRGL
jgi:hypothetical protein